MNLSNASHDLEPASGVTKLRLIRLFNAILLSLLLTACGSIPRRVYLPTEGQVIDGVNEGYRVDVFMNDDTSHNFVVTRVDNFGLHGKSVSLAYGDIQAVVVVGTPTDTALQEIGIIVGAFTH